MKKKVHSPRKSGCLKKIIIGCIIVVVGLVVLYNHLVNAATYLRVEPNEIRASKAGGSCKVDIDYDGYVWLINHQPDWVDIEENERDFVLSVDPNPTGRIREGSITIQSGNLLAQVVIRQNAYTTVLRASETSVKFDKSGGKKDIYIETDGCDWTADYTNWMKVVKVSETELRIQCPQNSNEYRIGTITVKEDNARAVINITQGGTCNNCHGSGRISCSACLGLGRVGFGWYRSDCAWCGGTGEIKCSLCKGSGIRE